MILKKKGITVTVLAIASLNEYANPSTAVLATSASIPRINLPLWQPTWAGSLSTTNFSVESMPAVDDDENRNWLRTRATASNGTGALYRYFEFKSQDIDPSLLKIGTSFCLGFHFATQTMYQPNMRGYVCVRTPGNTLQATPTFLANYLIGQNEKRWIDFVVDVLPEQTEEVPDPENPDQIITKVTVEAGSLDIRIYINRVLAHSMRSGPNQLWAVGTGDNANAIHRSTTATHGMAYNDFIITQGPTTVPSDLMVGPVKIRKLELADPVVEGKWQVPTGKTMKEALSAGSLFYQSTIPADQIILSDKNGGKLTSTFKAPITDDTIIAMSETIVAQRPVSMASALEYQQVYADAVNGPKLRYNFGGDSTAKFINMPIVVPKNGATSLTAEDIESRGIVFNSAKSTVSGD